VYFCRSEKKKERGKGSLSIRIKGFFPLIFILFFGFSSLVFFTIFVFIVY
jgi:hypothetical protein